LRSSPRRQHFHHDNISEGVRNRDHFGRRIFPYGCASIVPLGSHRGQKDAHFQLATFCFINESSTVSSSSPSSRSHARYPEAHQL
jgi:hypothetical protein